MAEDFEFFVDSPCQGRITARALLASEGTISLPLYRELLRKRFHGRVTRIYGKGWYFNIGYFDGEFIVQRNGCHLSIDEEWLEGKNLPELMLVSWRIDCLMLSFGDYFTHWDYPQLVEWAPLVPPPVELVRWVRKQELLPVEIFETEEDFLLRVHTSAQRFEDRFRAILNGNFFWDIERDGNKVLSRKPKREIDIHAVVHGMLLDHMQLSNIDIFPEVRSSAGAVDFLLLSALKDGTMAKICIEFKNAHSPDLISGLSKQLHAYMEKLDVRNGAYCVLDYRNSDFNLPVACREDLVGMLHREDKRFSRWHGRAIKIHWLDIGSIGT